MRMPITDAITSLLSGPASSASSASGPACGGCAAKEIEIQRLNAKVAEQARTIKGLTAIIGLVHQAVAPEVAKAKALKMAGKPGYELKQFVLARKILKIIKL